MRKEKPFNMKEFFLSYGILIEETKTLKLYLLEQDTVIGYDTYGEAVVCAWTEEEAKKIHPSGCDNWTGLRDNEWSNMRDVKVTLLGMAAPGIELGVILATYYAG